MPLLDSNLLIYAIQPEHQRLRELLFAEPHGISEITRLEVLGYHKLEPDDREDLEVLIGMLELHPVSRAVIDRAIALRQQQKMSLGDAIIAATALIQDQPLITRNLKDFAHLPTLKLLDPLA